MIISVESFVVAMAVEMRLFFGSVSDILIAANDKTFH